MNSRDLRSLRPVLDHFTGYAQAIRGQSSDCTCSIADSGRYAADGRCPRRLTKKDLGTCRTAVHLAIRVHLGSLHLRVDHLDDRELDQAIDDLHTLTLTVQRLTPEQFADAIKRALRAERVRAHGDGDTSA